MTFREFINEGTTAAIIVKNGDKYDMSYLQYDGMSVGPDLTKYFGTEKLAKKLIQKSGDIRGIDGNRVEFYEGRALLIKKRDEKYIVEEANMFGNYIYFFDGTNWYMTKNRISSLDPVSGMKKL